jgi:hypothetical protein
MASRISMGARREVLAAVAKRYRTAGRVEKGRILDELTATTGWHRKHAVRALSTAGSQTNPISTGANPAADLSLPFVTSVPRSTDYPDIRSLQISRRDAMSQTINIQTEGGALLAARTRR